MRRILLSSVLLLGLAACVGPATPPDMFHRVDAAPPVRHFAHVALPGVVEVERLAADGVLTERAVAFSTGAGRPLTHYKYDYWSEPPALMLQDRLAVYLRRAEAADRVVTPDLRVLADWTLRGKLRRFEQQADGGQAVMDMQLAVISARDGSLVLLQDYTEVVPTGSDKVEAVALALNIATDRIFARFLADLGRARGAALVPQP